MPRDGFISAAERACNDPLSESVPLPHVQITDTLYANSASYKVAFDD